ncbi:uncharacterized protein LOC135083628 [Ostrinia nubilalis]|uniref:uncharacterized protein LOC114364928 n=1 Tax=Ostrinia furnacalis TaxID=93504 RepID=UPI001039650B|nr:uncharacterized protein LOC114364928 [Ostrinia furnacalis]
MKIFGLLCLVAVASCGPVAQDESVVRLMATNFVDCANSELTLCLKEHALRATEKLRAVRKLNIIDGVTILNSSPKEARSLDTLPSEPEERNKEVTERLWSTASDLLQRSELELSFPGSEDDENDSRALNEVEESRGKKKKETKKKLKMLIPLVLIAKAKAIALVVLSLVVIAASIFKLALLAKIAFIVKAISILKALLAKKNEHHEEEVWAPPHDDHGHGGHGGWEGGWSRSKKDAGNLAYSAYRK